MIYACAHWVWIIQACVNRLSAQLADIFVFFTDFSKRIILAYNIVFVCTILLAPKRVTALIRAKPKKVLALRNVVGFSAITTCLFYFFLPHAVFLIAFVKCLYLAFLRAIFSQLGVFERFSAQLACLCLVFYGVERTAFGRAVFDAPAILENRLFTQNTRFIIFCRVSLICCQPSTARRAVFWTASICIFTNHGFPANRTRPALYCCRLSFSGVALD